MRNTHIKNAVLAVVIIIIIGSVFMMGAFVGSKNQLQADQLDAVVNKENPLAAKVDFAPFWKVWQTLNEKYVSTKHPLPNDQAKVWGAAQGLAASLGDPYTVFFPPAESKMFQSDISGNFEGVGMEIDTKDGVLTVISPLKGSPAEKAGVKAGDKIIKINASSTIDMTTDAAVKIIRGPKGTPVTITVMREGRNAAFDIKMIRDVIDVPTIETQLRKDGIFVITLDSFTATSPELFRNALRQFVDSGSNKLILDLRGNPGGYLEAAVDMASWFLPQGKLIVSEDFGKNGSPQYYRSKGYNIFDNNLKFIILVDNGSASASEILAGALQEQGRAKLVGVNTFGKGSVQELVPITADTSLKVTVARWLTPNGTSISEGGLKPDYEVKRTQADIDKKIDPQMDKAVELLSGK